MTPKLHLRELRLGRRSRHARDRRPGRYFLQVAADMGLAPEYVEWRTVSLEGDLRSVTELAALIESDMLEHGPCKFQSRILVSARLDDRTRRRLQLELERGRLHEYARRLREVAQLERALHAAPAPPAARWDGEVRP